MPRPLRVEFPEALYHVTARGVMKAPIVADDSDRLRWMEYLKEAVLRFALELYAFVLMDNHYHLFVCAPLANLGKAMQFLNGAYAMYFNVRHERSGHLFERRYRGILIEDRGHYSEVSRYVHLNPVRAGIVERPEEYLWSSYAGYHWGRTPLSWLDYGRVLAEYGEGKEARRRYREFVAEGIGGRLAAPWAEAHEGWVLGGRRFIEKIYGMLASERGDGRWAGRAALAEKPLAATLDQIAHAVCGEYNIKKSNMTGGTPGSREARGVFTYLACYRAGLPAARVAAYLGLSHERSALQTARRTRARMKRKEEIRRRIARLEANLAIL